MHVVSPVLTPSSQNGSMPAGGLDTGEMPVGEHHAVLCLGAEAWHQRAAHCNGAHGRLCG